MIYILCVLGSETKKIESDGNISRLIKSKNLNQVENMKHQIVLLYCVNRTLKRLIHIVLYILFFIVTKVLIRVFIFI